MIEKIEHYTKENLIGQKRTFFARENKISQSYPLHFHDYYELEIILEGEGVMTLNGKDIYFSPNTVFFISPDDFHSYTLSDDATVLNVSFCEEMLLRKNPANRILSKKTSVLEISQKSTKIIEDICRNLIELNGDNIKSETHLLYALFDMLPTFYELKSSDSYTDKAISYIDIHFKENLTAQDVAKYCNINTDYLNNLFKKDLDKTVTQYIREKRITYADTLLRITNLSVSEIAFGCGFQSIQTFNRLYKEYYNQTPSRNKKALP